MKETVIADITNTGPLKRENQMSEENKIPQVEIMKQNPPYLPLQSQKSHRNYREAGFVQDAWTRYPFYSQWQKSIHHFGN